MTREQAIKELISVFIPIGRSQADRYIEHLIQIINHEPTLEEVKKEWEDDGWSFIGTKTIMICKYVGGNIFSTTDIQLDLDKKDCFIRGILNCRELQRLIKTFSALGWEI